MRYWAASNRLLANSNFRSDRVDSIFESTSAKSDRTRIRSVRLPGFGMHLLNSKVSDMACSKNHCIRFKSRVDLDFRKKTLETYPFDRFWLRWRRLSGLECRTADWGPFLAEIWQIGQRVWWSGLKILSDWSLYQNLTNDWLLDHFLQKGHIGELLEKFLHVWG